RRLTQEQLPLYVGMDLVPAGRDDVPISAWDESFLPMQLREHLRDVRVRHADGTERPLVPAERQLFEATREPEPGAPRDLRIPFLLAGIVAGVAIAALGAMGTRRAGARTGFVVTAMTWSIVAGLVETIMVLTWTATDHVFMY